MEDMKLCNDAAILEEAAKTAIELCGETKRWFTANKIRRLARRNALLVGDLIIEVIKLRKAVSK